MIIPVKCFTCGTVIANKYRYYCEEVRKRKMLKDMNIADITKNSVKGGMNNEFYVEKVVYITPDFSDKTPEGEVLDELGLNKMCCRRHMLTHVDID